MANMESDLAWWEEEVQKLPGFVRIATAQETGLPPWGSYATTLHAVSHTGKSLGHFSFAYGVFSPARSEMNHVGITPIEMLCDLLGVGALATHEMFVHVEEILVPEQCAMIFLNHVGYHVTITKLSEEN